MPRPTRANYAKATQYVCYALHHIPDEPLLTEHVSAYDYGSYTPQWATRGASAVAPQGACVAYLLPKQIALLPLPVALSADDAPYCVGYTFAFGKVAQPYCPVAQYYGWTIATLPMHDMQRAHTLRASAPEQSLYYAERAITSLYQLHAKALEPQREALVERLYARFLKLSRLCLAETFTPEGNLALTRALENASRCVHSLNKTY